MAKIERKQGDTITVSETFERPGSRSSQALDLSDAQSVQIYVDHPSSGDLVVNDTAEITDAANGMVEYTLGGTQTARQGKHRLEFVAEFAGGETFSYPQTGFVSLKVTDPAARELPIEELADGDASVTELAADAIRANTASAVDVMDALDLNNNPITSLPVPSNPADAARKDGLDTVASDLSSVESDLTSQVTRFDELAIDRGPISSRPTSGDYDDQMYYAVDQRILWRWDAGSSDWNAAGGLGVSSQRLPVTSYLDAVDVSTLAAGDVNLSGTLTGLLLGDAADVAGNPLQNVDTVTASGTAISVDSPVAGQSPQTETHLTTKGYVDSVAQGLDWRESVLERRNDPPATPSDGDRYLVDDAPTGDWSANADEIAEWGADAAAWVFYDPNEGWAVFVESLNVLETFVDGAWIDFGSAIDHGALNGTGDDDHLQYLHVDGRRSLTGSLDADDNDLENVGAVSETENVVADAGASYDIDLSDGGVHKITLTQDCDITLSGIDAAASNSATLIVEQDGTGGHSLTWSTAVLWPRGNPPSVSDGAGQIDRLAFTHIDGDWLGSEAGAGFA